MGEARGAETPAVVCVYALQVMKRWVSVEEAEDEIVSSERGGRSEVEMRTSLRGGDLTCEEEVGDDVEGTTLRRSPCCGAGASVEVKMSRRWKCRGGGDDIEEGRGRCEEDETAKRGKP